MIPELPFIFWQYFDFISLLPIAFGIVWILSSHKRVNGNYLKTISHTVAASRRSQALFSGLMTIFFPLYYAFLWFWVGPYTQAPSVFYWLLIPSAVAEMVFVWVPATGVGVKSKLHSWMAGFVGLTMFIIPVLLLQGSVSEVGVAAIIGYYLFVGILGALGIVYFYSKRRSITLSLEIIYCIAFLLTVSIVAHT